jgi:NitT/TauT family transport system permease protein
MAIQYRVGDTAMVVTMRIAILVAVLVLWQWGYYWQQHGAWFLPDIFNPYFISNPAEIWRRFLRLGCLVNSQDDWLIGTHGGFSACLATNDNNLWYATFATLENTFWGFVTGVASGVVGGFLLGRSEFLSRIFSPFIVAVNSVPRIALVPLVILIFGLGDVSKVVTAWLIVVFLVFFNTFEGARSVDRDYISASRLLGASHWQVLRTVIVPSTMAWVFASLTPAISFALIGVIVGEFIAAEHGLGKIIVEAEARAEAADMMVAIFVMMVIGIVLAVGIERVQRYLLRWQNTR